MTILNTDTMMVSADMTDAFGSFAPVDAAGLVKEAGQTGIFIFSKSDYILYLKDAGGTWVLYGNIAGTREALTVPWGDNTAAYFRCANNDATIHVHRREGTILYDTTPENTTDDQNTLLTDAGSAAQAAQNYTFPEADGTVGQILKTNGAGQLDWAIEVPSSFTFDDHLIPDTNSIYDIGSAEYKVRHLFLSDNSIKFASGDLSVDGDNLTWNGETVGGTTEAKVVMVSMSAAFTLDYTETNERLTIPFDTVDQNSFGSAVWDPALYKFTAPETGFYYVNCSLYQQGIDTAETSQYQLRFESTNVAADSGGVSFRNYFPAGAPENTTYTHKLDKVCHFTAGDTLYVSLRNVGAPENDSSVHEQASLTNISIVKIR